jgi:hypothetical protein
MRRKLVIVIAVVVALAAASAGIAYSAGVGRDDDKPLTGATLERATDAALAHTGGGTVVETEIGDDGAAYGVEVRLPDGSQVEVELDENFEVLGQERDDDGAGEEHDGDDDD